MIPSENELQQIYDVSRATVRKAIQLLVNEGFMEKKKGKGTFVKLRKIEEQLPDAIDIMRRALMAGHPFNASLKLVSEDMSQPIAREFELGELLQRTHIVGIFGKKPA